MSKKDTSCLEGMMLEFGVGERRPLNIRQSLNATPNIHGGVLKPITKPTDSPDTGEDGKSVLHSSNRLNSDC